MELRIENLIKKIALRDVEIALLVAEEKGSIISAEIYSILKDVDKTYE